MSPIRYAICIRLLFHPWWIISPQTLVVIKEPPAASPSFRTPVLVEHRAVTPVRIMLSPSSITQLVRCDDQTICCVKVLPSGPTSH